MGNLYRRSGSPKWYGEYTDSTGKRCQRSTGTTIKRDAQGILTKWESDANNQRHGVSIAPSTTLETLLGEFIEYKGGSTLQHQSLSENRIRRVLDACDFTYPKDIDRIKVENAIRGFLTPSGNPLSLRSQGHYLTALKSFSKWLTTLRDALVRDPLAGIKKPNFEKDRKKKRRYLTREEWQWLKLTDNALLYEVAIATGFRSSELRALNPASLQADSIVLGAKHTKNGKEARQFIGKDLRKRLDGALPFTMPHKGDVAQMFRDDLAVAREKWLASKPPKALANSNEFLCPTNAAGDSLDFHALRHTCGAWLAIESISPKVIQAVMRHSTIVLTLDTYGHLIPGAEQDAALKLSVLLSQPLRRRATRQQLTTK